MSKKENKNIINKAKELLKSYGHDVKNGHLYELFSKLSNEISWNVASNKDINFKESVLNKFEKENLNLWTLVRNLYFEEMKKTKKPGLIKLGAFIEDGKPKEILEVDMELHSNSLFVGTMGSGKSVAMNSTLLSFIQSNPQNSLIFIVDTSKGAGDHREIFNLPKVFPVVHSEENALKTIDLIYNELESRVNEFYKIRVKDVSSYEAKTGKKIDRIILAFEDFHTICGPLLNFDNEYHIKSSDANKFYHIMRLGRAFGIHVIAASQRGLPSDIPQKIMENFANKLIFRVSKNESIYLTGAERASELKSIERGMCISNYGTIQFPLFLDDDKKKIISKINISETFNSFLITKDLILKSFNEKSNSETKNKATKSMDTENIDLLLKSIVERMGMKIIREMNSYDPHGLRFISQIGNVKIAISFKQHISEKDLYQINEGMVKNGCLIGYIFSMNSEYSQDILRTSEQLNISIFDKEETLRLSKQN